MQTEFVPSAPQIITAKEQRALDAIDHEGLITCLQELIRIPSVSGTKEENDAQRWFAEKMRESGLEVDLWNIPIPETRADAQFPGWEVDRTEALGLVGTWGKPSSAGRTLVLNGHIDVVPPGDLGQWADGGPYSGARRDGNIYGRGACDMKAGLVCNLYAVKALQAAGISLSPGHAVQLHSVVGEEDGGLGTFATLRRGYRGDAAIITEPTDLQCIPACAGALTFRLVVPGRSVHASVRLEGVDALEHFIACWQALRKLEAERNANADPLMKRFPLPYPLLVGTVRGGSWPSSVPDELVAEGRLGVKLNEAPEVARQALEQEIARVCQSDEYLRSHPIRVEWFGGQFASGAIAGDHPLVRLVQSNHAALHNGAIPDVHGAPYGSDLRLMVGIGRVPALHYGPGHVKHAHAPNEFVPLEQLRSTVRTLVLSILRFCEHS